MNMDVLGKYCTNKHFVQFVQINLLRASVTCVLLNDDHKVLLSQRIISESF